MFPSVCLLPTTGHRTTPSFTTFFLPLQIHRTLHNLCVSRPQLANLLRTSRRCGAVNLMVKLVRRMRTLVFSDLSQFLRTSSEALIHHDIEELVRFRGSSIRVRTTWPVVNSWPGTGILNSVTSSDYWDVDGFSVPSRMKNAFHVSVTVWSTR